MVGERKKKEKGSLERKEDVERERESVRMRERDGCVMVRVVWFLFLKKRVLYHYILIYIFILLI